MEKYINGINHFRKFSDSSIQHEKDSIGDDIVPSSTTSTRHRRVALKSGRARRKRELKQREEKREEHTSSTEEKTAIHNSSGEKDNDYNNAKPIGSNTQWPHQNGKDGSDSLFGVSIGNPIRERYIESQRKIIYPKTASEWRGVFKRTWDKYLWTFEGFLLAEKKRDADGNIIPPGEEETEDEEDEKESLGDKAKEAADQISSNVQKNMFTLKEEIPKLVEMGKEATGITTKEELRAWVGEQLKLGTACLSEFMKGYRKGRDDEVDRMLHEYFKDLDEKEESAKDVAVEESIDSDDAENVDTNPAKREKRLWGRRERRKLKAVSNKVKTAANQNDVISNE